MQPTEPANVGDKLRARPRYSWRWSATQLGIPFSFTFGLLTYWLTQGFSWRGLLSPRFTVWMGISLLLAVPAGYVVSLLVKRRADALTGAKERPAAVPHFLPLAIWATDQQPATVVTARMALERAAAALDERGADVTIVPSGDVLVFSVDLVMGRSWLNTAGRGNVLVSESGADTVVEVQVSLLRMACIGIVAYVVMATATKDPNLAFRLVGSLTALNVGAIYWGMRRILNEAVGS
jgi:hypothetical protein